MSRNIEFSSLTIMEVMKQANFSIFVLKIMFIHSIYLHMPLTNFNHLIWILFRC